MPLTLEQYATYLDTRGLPWPAPPVVEPAKAKPKARHIPGIKVVLWNVYGTLLAIPFGELLFEHPQQLIMDVALDKTIEEFKMWGSMSRKPGQPAEYMRTLYAKELLLNKASPGGERFPEVLADKVWEGLIKKLFLKDYTFDAGFYGSLNEYSKKVAYFFHASMQATAAQPTAANALRLTADAGISQSLLADGQCFTTVQLMRGLKNQDPGLDVFSVLPEDRRFLSYEARARKPSETLYRRALASFAAEGVKPHEILHVGSNLARDLTPAKKLGMHTALYAGDKASVDASPEMLKDAATRPDALMTSLDQIAEIVQ